MSSRFFFRPRRGAFDATGASCALDEDAVALVRALLLALGAALLLALGAALHPFAAFAFGVAFAFPLGCALAWSLLGHIHFCTGC